MSRIGKQIIAIPSGVEVSVKEGKVFVKGPKGQLERELHKLVTVNITDNKVTVDVVNKESKLERSLWGTFAAHIKNMIAGVQTPYSKKLILEGVGFKSEVKGKEFHFALGFSHPVIVKIPETITATADKNNITITGIDKELVGSFTAAIRALKKPEPYKGKGMRYGDEVIRRKQGKKTV